jgi:hypothetical protein
VRVNGGGGNVQIGRPVGVVERETGGMDRGEHLTNVLTSSSGSLFDGSRLASVYCIVSAQVEARADDKLRADLLATVSYA